MTAGNSRVERGLSQEQLALMASINVRTLQSIKRGANASSETFKFLASVLDNGIPALRKETDMTTRTGHTRPDLPEDEQRALDYVQGIRTFYRHALLYVVVIVGLAVVNLFTSPGNLWFLWAALGWGIGLIAHGLSVFEIVNLFGEKWEKRQVAKRLAKSRQDRNC